MGGGDLNSKKSWHPNTMKNQERVWKAEQAAAEENKRIVELQRERAVERDRAELNELAKQSTGSSSDNRLHWMYDKPDKQVQHEDYLLGKAIDKRCEQSAKSEQEVIPAVARRVVGSSMLATSGDTQVDLVRKMREDPLLLVKERERAARAALLNNPLQRRKLTELLRKEQEQKKESKIKKKPKKEKNLDNMLAAKLNALSGEKGIDLAALLASDDSDSVSSSDEKSKRKKKKKKDKKSKKSKERKNSSDSDTDSSEYNIKKHKLKSREKKIISNVKNKSMRVPETLSDSGNYSIKSRDRKYEALSHTQDRFSKRDSTKRKSESDDSDNIKSKISKRETASKRQYDSECKKSQRRYSSDYDHRRDSRKGTVQDAKRKVETDQQRGQIKSGGLSEDRAARLAAMAAAGMEREVQRGRRVAEQRAADRAADVARPRLAARSEARALPDSLEDRIHSNRHYIQRDRRHMNEHFARR